MEGSFLSWWPRVLIGGRGRLQPPCYHDYRGITRRWIVKEREREIERGWWRTRKSPSNGERREEGREERWKEKEGTILARREEERETFDRIVEEEKKKKKGERRKNLVNETKTEDNTEAEERKKGVEDASNANYPGGEQ